MAGGNIKFFTGDLSKFAFPPASFDAGVWCVVCGVWCVVCGVLRATRARGVGWVLVRLQSVWRA